MLCVLCILCIRVSGSPPFAGGTAEESMAKTSVGLVDYKPLQHCTPVAAHARATHALRHACVHASGAHACTRCCSACAPAASRWCRDSETP